MYCRAVRLMTARWQPRLLLAPFHPRPATPYQRVLNAVMEEGSGLIAASHIFDEFKVFYRSNQATASGNGPVQDKPLTFFCGSPRDVRPMTELLLKVLCDLQRLEDMRFLFMQCVLELDAASLSSELFNVYLLAISMSDSYNAHEVDNVLDLLRLKEVEPDVVTQLSVLLLYLRLGRVESGVLWWPSIVKEVREQVAQNRQDRHPLLGLRLQHCLQTLMRLHTDVTMLRECIELLQLVAPERLTSAVLLPCFVRGVSNGAVPPTMLIKMIPMIEAHGSTPSTSSPSPAQTPALSSAWTVLRLAAKCSLWEDCASAEYLREYLRRSKEEGKSFVLSPHHEAVVALLYVDTLVQVKQYEQAFDVLETEVTAPLHQPADRPKLFVEDLKLLLLSRDPLSSFIASISFGGADAIADILQQRKEKHEGGGIVTSTSLDVVMGAYAQIGDGPQAEALLQQYSSFHATPTSLTYAFLLTAYAADVPHAAVRRWRSLADSGELSEVGCAVDGRLLRVVMDVTLDAGDLPQVLRLLDEYGATCGMEVRQSSRLLEELAALGDASAVRRAVTALRKCRVHVDRKSLAKAIATLTAYGEQCDDIHA